MLRTICYLKPNQNHCCITQLIIQHHFEVNKHINQIVFLVNHAALQRDFFEGFCRRVWSHYGDYSALVNSYMTSNEQPESLLAGETIIKWWSNALKQFNSLPGCFTLYIWSCCELMCLTSDIQIFSSVPHKVTKTCQTTKTKAVNIISEKTRSYSSKSYFFIFT